MGIVIRALAKVKRGHSDLYPGRIVEVSEKEAARLIKAGLAEEYLRMQRSKPYMQTDNPPIAEEAVSRLRRGRPKGDTT